MGKNVRYYFFALSIFFALSSWANQLTDLKVDSNWKIKYDPTQWNYIYFKQASSISSNIFEHKREKIRLILQKETHLNPSPGNKNLMADECLKAHQYFSKNFNGNATKVTINSTELCYVEYKNISGDTNHEFLYPDSYKTRSYDLLTYTWKSKNPATKEIVINFLKGFLK